MRLFLSLSLILLLAGVSSAQTQFDTKAKTAILYDFNTGTILYTKQAHKPFPPASMMKIATAEYVFNELAERNISLQTKFKISKHAWRRGGAPARGSTMFAELGSEITVENLLRGMIIQSGNDAAIALAEGIAETEPNFAKLITDRSKRLGAKNTVFKNASGLPEEGQVTTAYDLLQIAVKIISDHPARFHLFSEQGFEWNNIYQNNRNPLFGFELGADGMKTGYTKEAGYGIVATAQRDGRRVLAVLSGMASKKQRFEEARRLLDHGFDNFESLRLLEKGTVVGNVSVYGGVENSVEVELKRDIDLFMLIGSGERIVARLDYNWPVKPPVKRGDQLGTLRLLIDGSTVQTTPVFATKDVAQGGLAARSFAAFKELAFGWIDFSAF